MTPRQAAMEIAEREARAADRRLRDAEYAAALRDRDVGGIAPIDPMLLVAEFAADPESAYLMLSRLTPSQLTCQAIDTTVYLARRGKEIPWLALLERWEQRMVTQQG